MYKKWASFRIENVISITVIHCAQLYQIYLIVWRLYIFVLKLFLSVLTKTILNDLKQTFKATETVYGLCNGLRCVHCVGMTDHYVLRGFFLLFERHPRRSSNGTRPVARLCNVLGSEPDLKMNVQNLSPLKRGAPKLPIFGWLYDVIATWTRYIFGTKRAIDRREND